MAKPPTSEIAGQSDGRFKPDPGKSAEWARGAYLVEGAEHYGLCHTPKNVMGGDENSRAMQGSVLQSWYAPNAGYEPERSAAKAILAHVRKGNLRDGFTARDVQRHDWSLLCPTAFDGRRGAALR
jgi:hypothetical protein